MCKNLLLSILFLVVITVLSTAAKAADPAKDSFGTVSTVSINDSDVKEGDIIVLTGNELKVSSNTYQNVMVGVVNEKPKFSENADTTPGGSGGSTKKQIITAGNVKVNVNLKGGTIKKGDWITSSANKGEGMKATKNGYVLGSAIEDFSSGNKDDKKQILVSLNVHYVSGGQSVPARIGDIFKLATLAAYDQPKLALRYISSSLTVIVTIIFSFLSFGRVARLGIIALGRNPLASVKIYKGVFLNALGSIAIIGAGIAAALFLIRI